jgi:hypothetical protein
MVPKQSRPGKDELRRRLPWSWPVPECALAFPALARHLAPRNERLFPAAIPPQTSGSLVRCRAWTGRSFPRQSPVIETAGVWYTLLLSLSKVPAVQSRTPSIVAPRSRTSPFAVNPPRRNKLPLQSRPSAKSALSPSFSNDVPSQSRLPRMVAPSSWTPPFAAKPASRNTGPALTIPSPRNPGVWLPERVSLGGRARSKTGGSSR